MERYRYSRGRSIAASAAFLAVLCIFSARARAAEGGAGEKPSQRGVLAGEVGWEELGEDGYLSVGAKFGLRLPVPAVGCEGDGACWTRFRAGLGVPLRLRMVDRGVEQDGLVREEDWDEATDFLRIVRYVEYGRPSEPIHAKAGELGQAVLGHGTIVDRYFNVITPDHYQLGLQANANSVWGGGSLMIDNLAGPSVAGGRMYVRPWAFVDPEAWLHRVAIGVSLVGDVSAPYRLRRGFDGSPVIGPAQRPRVNEQRGTAIGGIDLEVTAVDSEVLTLAPYIDGNLHFQLGGGMHTGILGSLRPMDALEVGWKLEYRLLGEGYLPGYVGPLYEIDRFQFLGWQTELPAPKLRAAASRDGGGVHGGYGQLTMRLLDWAEVSGGYADHQGEDNASMNLQLKLSPIDRFQLGLFYYKQTFDRFGEIFERDDALLVGESRVRIWGPLYAKAAYNRLWQLREDGGYEPVDRWSIGVGASMSFGAR